MTEWESRWDEIKETAEGIAWGVVGWGLTIAAMAGATGLALYAIRWALGALA